MKKGNNKLRGMILAIMGGVFWGISGVVAEYLMRNENISASWLVGVKMMVAGCLILLYQMIKGNKNSLSPFKYKHEIIQLIIFSVLGVLGLQYSFFKAIQVSNAATATILQYLSPILLVVYFIFEKRELPNKLSIVSILISLVGTFLLVTKGNINELAISSQGLFWGLLSAFLGAFYIIQPRKLMAKYGTTLIIGWGMLIGGIVFQLYQPIWRNMPEFTPRIVLGVLVITIIGTVFSYICLLTSTEYIPPQFSSLLTSFEPLSSAVLSVLFLGLVLTPIEIISMLLIVLAVFLLSRCDIS
ncbi:DMT family transporter [Vagococcus luciliae]|uniref:Inner membrane transporter YicL n=1 Tax=Vagococcus luciliae TaxID=2920380 RepID=A0ABY5NZU6_9ENTE|nr:DMT family transporter [Vagococcus luciliae]UUV99084.1 putative inner membrane transporter YicL [Vagococcus luciliae]